MEDNIFTITENFKNAEQPPELSIQLKEHQLKLLYQCYKFENEKIYRKHLNLKTVTQAYIKTRMGIIADSVGSGKSFVILSIIAKEINFEHRNITHVSINDFINVEYYHEARNPILKKANILVIPHDLYNQWKKYIETYTKYNTYYINDIVSLNLCDDTKLNCELIVICDNYYNSFSEKVNRKRYIFPRLIFDEADSIKFNEECKKIECNFYWFVSSSYQNLLHCKNINSTGFIYDIFDNLRDSYESLSLYLKNKNELIQDSFKLQSVLYKEIVCKNTLILNILESSISPDIQQLICTGDIDSAIKALDIETTTESNIVYVVCNKLNDELNNYKVDLDAIKNKYYKNKDMKNAIIEKQEYIINETKQKIKNIQDKINKYKVDPITLEDINKAVIVKCCKQVFDFTSIALTLTQTDKCPMCRTQITKDDFVYINNKEKKEEEKVECNIGYKYNKYEKNENLLYLIKYEIPSDSKIIIFSEYDNTFINEIFPILSKNNIKYDNLFNKDEEFDHLKAIEYKIQTKFNLIQEAINNFKNNTTNILYLNAKYNGAGLNLECATDIIIYHRVSKPLKTQIIGRAQRFGRKGRLRVWQLLYEHE